jgi:hypothetical protein
MTMGFALFVKIQSNNNREGDTVMSVRIFLVTMTIHTVRVDACAASAGARLGTYLLPSQPSLAPGEKTGFLGLGRAGHMQPQSRSQPLLVPIGETNWKGNRKVPRYRQLCLHSLLNHRYANVGTLSHSTARTCGGSGGGGGGKGGWIGTWVLGRTGSIGGY